MRACGFAAYLQTTFTWRVPTPKALHRLTRFTSLKSRDKPLRYSHRIVAIPPRTSISGAFMAFS
jgi:hypothetical protein